MSRDITVLTPNGRRQKVNCTPNTSMLQVLEDVCLKQGFQPGDYDLKHHNHLLDLTTTLRYTNLPNKATLEMVEAIKKREEANVTVGLLMEDGERRTADFSPNTSLFDLVTALAPDELTTLQQPTILYMRQEVTGVPALQVKTLRQLGLLGGRAILRLLNKTGEAKQANVSAVYRRPHSDQEPLQDAFDKAKTYGQSTSYIDASAPGPSNIQKSIDHKSFDPIKMLREEKEKSPTHEIKNESNNQCESANEAQTKETPMDVDQIQSHEINDIKPQCAMTSKSSKTLLTQENLERRLQIEEEVTFVGPQKAVVFIQPDEPEDELNDLPDDFYELSIDEVRKLYKDLQKNRLELENMPLLTAAKRDNIEKQTSEQLIGYKNAVVRVQFPDHIILQGIFAPNNTVQDIRNFIKEHLQYPEKNFHIFTTALKGTLDPNQTLLEAKFVPCVHMHFKWMVEDAGQQFLKTEILAKKISSEAASILASKYRARSRRKQDDIPEGSQRTSSGHTSTSKSSKLPKWLKK